jgi:hypothetical protein
LEIDAMLRLRNGKVNGMTSTVGGSLEESTGSKMRGGETAVFS